MTGVVHHGLVYADSQGSPNLRIGIKRGRVAGSFTADREPAVAGSVIFTASADALRAEDLTTHRVIWERRQNFVLPPLVVGRTVFGVHADGTVVQFRATTGRQLWRSHTGTVPIYPPEVDRVPTAPAAAHGVLAVPEGDKLVVFAS